jgi:phosphatidylglycerophosphatase C
VDIPTVVFDLDGTLLDGDSTTLWLWQLTRRSPFRLMPALMILPVALPMILVPRLRGFSGSTLLWIATVGLDGEQVAQSVRALAAQLNRRALSLQWRDAGLAALEQHIAAGRRVVVVTGAPAILAKALLQPWAGQIAIIGSTLKCAGRGWIIDSHCRNQEKCRRLLTAGYGQRWAYAYTDSWDDLPLLERADRPFIVDGSARLMKRIRKYGISEIEDCKW